MFIARVRLLPFIFLASTMERHSANSSGNVSDDGPIMLKILPVGVSLLVVLLAGVGVFPDFALFVVVVVVLDSDNCGIGILCIFML